MSKKKKRPIPEFGLPIIETHFHLDYLKEAPAEQVLAEARAMGVERFMSISVAPDNMPTAKSLAEAHQDLFFTAGVHPHEAASFDSAADDWIQQHVAHPKMVAVGEIGLDYFYDHCDREVQKAAFRRQLEIATQAGLPVVIHTREADEDTMEILNEMAPAMPRKGVVHSFTSGMELAKRAVELGFCLGINGIVTFNKADNVREVVAATPLENLLLETDAPYLTPTPYRGVENAPKYLPLVAERIADVKGLSVEEVLRQTHINSINTFFSSEQTV